METTNDPANYRRLSEPFDNAEIANVRIKTFFEGVKELRQQCGIPDVLTVVAVNVMCGDKEGRAITYASLGDLSRVEMMAAYVLGEERAEHRGWINRLMAEGKQALHD